MLFHLTWRYRDSSEDATRRTLAVFAQWQPPVGAEFQAFYGYADGMGGAALIEVDSAETLTRTTAPWVPWLAFETTPVVPINSFAEISADGMAFRDSV